MLVLVPAEEIAQQVPEPQVPQQQFALVSIHLSVSSSLSSQALVSVCCWSRSPHSSRLWPAS